MASIYDKSSLVLIPSGTKTGKVYSQKPVSGDGDFTFTRSSAATRVNADGNIEKETQNLLKYKVIALILLGLQMQMLVDKQDPMMEVRCLVLTKTAIRKSSKRRLFFNQVAQVHTVTSYLC